MMSPAGRFWPRLAVNAKARRAAKPAKPARGQLIEHAADPSRPRECPWPARCDAVPALGPAHPGRAAAVAASSAETGSGRQKGISTGPSSRLASSSRSMEPLNVLYHRDWDHGWSNPNRHGCGIINGKSGNRWPVAGGVWPCPVRLSPSPVWPILLKPRSYGKCGLWTTCCPLEKRVSLSSSNAFTIIVLVANAAYRAPKTWSSRLLTTSSPRSAW